MLYVYVLWLKTAYAVAAIVAGTLSFMTAAATSPTHMNPMIPVVMYAAV